MVDTVNVMRGVHVVIASKAEQRVPIDEDLADGVDVARISANEIPSELCHNPWYDVFLGGTKTISVVKPFEKLFLKWSTWIEEIWVITSPSVIDVRTVL